MKLVNRFVLIRHVEESDRVGSVVLSSHDKQEHSLGVVEDVAKSVVVCKKGSPVIYHKHSGVQMNVGGISYLAVDEHAVLCVIIDGKFHMTTDRLIVTETTKDTHAGAIILADTDGEIKTSGEVLAVADGVKEITVGETVMFSRMAGVHVVYENTTYKILSKKEILAVT